MSRKPENEIPFTFLDNFDVEKNVFFGYQDMSGKLSFNVFLIDLFMDLSLFIRMSQIAFINLFF